MEVIVKPVVSEKMTDQTDKLNRYGFVVHDSANKIQIKKAVEDAYGVTVESVNTMNYAGEIKIKIYQSGFNQR